MPSLPAILGTTAVLGLMGGAIVYGFVHMRRVRESWSRIARRRGWSAPDEPRGILGAWSVSMRGVDDGVSVSVSTITRRHGKSRSTYTRVGAAMQRDLRSRLVVERALWIKLAVGMPRVEIGGTVDARLRVSADDPKVARDVVTSSFLADWERLPRFPTLRIENGEAALEWHGVEADEEKVERAIDFVTSLARAPRERRLVA